MRTTLSFLLIGIFIITCTKDEEIKTQPEEEKCLGCETGIITDSRDGKTYKTVKIGDQWWMAENLNIGTQINSDRGGYLQTDNNITEKYCYDNLESNCDTYGGLYEWPEMMQYTSSDTGTIGTTQGICPSGWHIPTEAEWKELMEYLRGGGVLAGSKMKETGTAHWNPPNEDATNESGFTALPGGLRHFWAGTFSLMGDVGKFWSSTKLSDSPDDSHELQLENDDCIAILDGSPNFNGLSVRCVKD